MSEDSRKVLQMLADGKVSVEEAERLIAALGEPPSATQAAGDVGRRGSPRFLRVVVDDEGHAPNGASKVNVRVPMQLLRAGVRLANFVPPVAREHVNEAMREQGIPFDINQLKPENLEALIEQLGELTVDVDQAHTKVRIFCE